ncbi:MAG: substrate-binding domain-containing protein [Collinsella sp.]
MSMPLRCCAAIECGQWVRHGRADCGEVLAGGSQAPTAVLAANDQMALGVIAALENAGLSVPDDVSVVGIDDALEGLVPHNRQTTLRFDLRGVGKLAFEAAIGELVYRGDSCRVRGRTLDC